jgi:uncharacterized protein YegP (UPF0339 family)
VSGKFETRTAKSGQFYFHLKVSNGQIILSSEMYECKASALNGIESVKKNAPDDKRYERKETKSGHPMFNLKAANHEIIGTSEGYNTTEARENGIESVKTNRPEAAVVDETA